MAEDAGSIIQIVKDIFATFTNLGWLPIPFFAAIGIMFALRIAFEQSSLSINTKESLRERMWIRLGIFAGTALFVALLQFGLQQPKTGFERTLALGFTFADVMFSYVITSNDRFKKAYYKNGFTSKGGNDDSSVTTDPGPSK